MPFAKYAKIFIPSKDIIKNRINHVCQVIFNRYDETVLSFEGIGLGNGSSFGKSSGIISPTLLMYSLELIINLNILLFYIFTLYYAILRYITLYYTIRGIYSAPKLFIVSSLAIVFSKLEDFIF